MGYISGITTTEEICKSVYIIRGQQVQISLDRYERFATNGISISV